MNESELDAYINMGGEDSPAWFDHVLNLARDYSHFHNSTSELDSSQFQDRCRRAAGIAFSIAKLRKERQRVGFVPLAFSDYIQGLVKVADVRLGPVLDWLKIGDLSSLELNSIPTLVKLARYLGIGLREVLVHVRIEFASCLKIAPLPLLLARYRSTAAGLGQLDECEVVLAQIESDYELEHLRALRRVEFDLRSAYKEQENSDG